MTTLDLTPVDRPHSASLWSKVLAQGRYETRVTVTNGEQLLVSIILPLLALAGLYLAATKRALLGILLSRKGAAK